MDECVRRVTEGNTDNSGYVFFLPQAPDVMLTDMEANFHLDVDKFDFKDRWGRLHEQFNLGAGRAVCMSSLTSRTGRAVWLQGQVEQFDFKDR